MNKKYNVLKRRLLDLGKRNSLMNYAHRISSNLEFFQDDFENFFYDFTSMKPFEVAKLFTNLDESINLSDFDEVKDEYDVEHSVTDALGVMTERKIRYTKEEIQEIKTRFEKKKNVNYLYSETIYSKTRSVLSLLERKDKLILEETGQKSLYMAFGIVTYKDKREYYEAPLCLIPVKIYSKKLNDKYYIEALDDDYLINQNLAYFLKAEYKLDISPKENEEFYSYIERIKDIISKVNFKFEERIALGIFSFSKIMMFKDLEENENKLLSNDIIKAFLGEENNLDIKLDGIVSTKEKALVLSSDSSQEKAIELALEGKSFVLQGPPGTGKSQTITNMLSSLILNKKKVLFVCEKAEALDVVRSNLAKCNLDSLALCLYSTKSSKQEVVKSIYSNIEMIKDGVIKLSSKGLDVIDKTYTLEDFFKDLDYELKNKTLLNMSALEIAENMLLDGDILDFEIVSIAKVKENKYLSTLDLLDIIKIKMNDLSEDFSCSSFKGFKDTKINKTSVKELHNISFKLSNDLNRLLTEINSLNTYLFKPTYICDLDESLKLLNLAGKYNNLSIRDFNIKDLPNKKTKLKSIDKFYKYLNKEKKYFESKYKASFMDLDPASDIEILKTKYSSSLKRLIGFNKYLSKFEDYTLKSTKLTYEEILEDLERLLELNKKYEQNSLNEAIISSSFSKFYFGQKTDFKYLEDLIDYLIQVNDILSNTKLDKSKVIEELGTTRDYEKSINLLSIKIEEIKEDINVFSKYFDIASLTIEELFVKSKNISLNTDEIYKYLDVIKELNKIPQEFVSFKELLLNKNIDTSNLKNSFIKTISYKLYNYIIDNNKFLSDIDNKIIVNNIDKYSSLIESLREVARVRTLEKVTSSWPHVNSLTKTNLEISTLTKELNKKKKLMSVRNLLSSISSLVINLKPIFMMSPLTVSSFLDLNKFEFDTVIFDEASQITLVDSIGAMGRGKQLIVVGDKEQLPPTNFFANEVEDEDYEDLESVLNEASNILPTVSLKWHYRSKDESLINSSNQFIYHNLTTIPSSNISDNLGLIYDYVENGTYEAIKTYNYNEALRVVDLLFFNIRRNPGKTIGIVTFNMKQQSLILSLVNKRRSKEKGCEDFFKNDSNFFIKNLETVQGDEKDIIILSTTFGYNKDGKLNMNFGPINREGGYRRLNVAITRAKEKLIVVSSLKYSDLDKKSLTNDGQIFLRDFLKYGEERKGNEFVSGEAKSNFICALGLKIEDYGYKVLYNVGLNSYKIDLVILDKENSNKAIMAILTNSDNYYLLSSIKDRNYLIDSLLISRGFKIMHLNDFASVNRIDETVSNIIKTISSECDIPLEEKTEEVLYDKEEDRGLDVYSLFDSYPNIISLIDIEALTRNTCEDKIINLLNYVSPISIDELKRLIAEPFFNKKLDTELENHIDTVISHIVKSGKAYKILNFLLKPSDILSLRFRKYDSLNPYNRKIEHIYVEEIESGFTAVLSYIGQTTSELLFKTFNSLLGYPKDSSDTERTFRRVINILKDKDVITVEGNLITYN